MTSFADHPLAMLTEIYIEALLVDEHLADQCQKSGCSLSRDLSSPTADAGNRSTPYFDAAIIWPIFPTK